MFRNDLFLCIKKSDFHNFVDDNAITATCDTLTEPLETFGQKPESAWFKQNELILNADKFQAIILNKEESEATCKLTIDNRDIKFTISVKLSVTIDDRLKLDQ